MAQSGGRPISPPWRTPSARPVFQGFVLHLLYCSRPSLRQSPPTLPSPRKAGGRVRSATLPPALRGEGRVGGNGSFLTARSIILYFCEVWAFRLSRFRYELVLFRRPLPGMFTMSDPAIVLLNIVLTRPCTVVRRANYIED